MNDILPANEPGQGSEAEPARAVAPTGPSPGSSQASEAVRPTRDELASRLVELDRMASLIGWGFPVLGIVAAGRMMLESSDGAAPVPGGWLAGLLGAVCILGSTLVIGLGLRSTLRVLAYWYSMEHPRAETASGPSLRPLAERLCELNERLRDLTDSLAALGRWGRGCRGQSAKR